MVTLKHTSDNRWNGSALDESSSALTILKASSLGCGGWWNQICTLTLEETLGRYSRAQFNNFERTWSVISFFTTKDFDIEIFVTKKKD
jgi:hypothetical protein